MSERDRRRKPQGVLQRSGGLFSPHRLVSGFLRQFDLNLPVVATQTGRKSTSKRRGFLQQPGTSTPSGRLLYGFSFSKARNRPNADLREQEWLVSEGGPGGFLFPQVRTI
jgi:hypothetical protein